MRDVSPILNDASAGEASSAEALLPLVYEELRNLAQARMTREMSAHTLQPTALVHEAWLRLVRDDNLDGRGRSYFFAAASTAMRRILVEHARKKTRLKRGGDLKRVDLDCFDVANPESSESLLLLDEVLTRLEQAHPDWAQVVELKYFGGMTHPEVAETLEVSLSTVERRWATAKLWMFEQLSSRGGMMGNQNDEHQRRGQDGACSASMRDEILYTAVGIDDEAERERFLETACGDDVEMRSGITRLLSRQADADSLFKAGSPSQFSATEIVNTLTDIPEFFEGGASSLPDDDEVGKQIGNYKLLQKIGEGGAGNVYLAEQSRPVRRQVALKIIKAGMDTKSVIARFEAERQALAMMEHANIAHVLNAGETEAGRPYFVMELVHGERITTYCDENRLTVRQRLELFVQVCNAIQHAHQKGIIHRDIKPSNVLITLQNGVPRPVVIDFGIAKATHGDLLTDKTIHTSVEHWIGTPAYMSPEQVDSAGSDIDTRSDVYSLGVLLYELLVGEPPFDQKELVKSGLNEMRRILLEREPLRPSGKLLRMDLAERKRIAAGRCTDIRRLSSELAGDLDWVVLKALEKDRARRYETADALAVDVRHFLNVEPVLACPPSRTYRLRKLIRRNRAWSAAIATVSLSLVVGLVVAGRLLAQERAARQRAVLAEKKALASERRQKKLLQEAEDHDRVTRAAYLILNDHLERADRIVESIVEIKRSTEAGWVLRELAEWHVFNRNWAKAGARYMMLSKVNEKDHSLAMTDDLLMGGPVLVEAGDIEGYERFRRAAIERFSGTRDAVLAERTMKISLLIPGDEELLEQLQPLRRLAARNARTPDKNLMVAWRCLSLALMDYRQGRYGESIEWGRKSLSCYTNEEARMASVYAIQGMARFRLGDVQSARVLLRLSQKIIRDGMDAGFQPDGRSGFWYDWLFARILLREAEAMMGP